MYVHVYDMYMYMYMTGTCTCIHVCMKYNPVHTRQLMKTVVNLHYKTTCTCMYIILHVCTCHVHVHVYDMYMYMTCTCTCIHVCMKYNSMHLDMTPSLLWIIIQ